MLILTFERRESIAGTLLSHLRYSSRTIDCVFRKIRPRIWIVLRTRCKKK